MLDLLDLMKEEATEKGSIGTQKSNLIRLSKKKFGDLSKPLEQKINEIENLETLEQWLENLIFAEKIEDIFNTK